jgi:hypothetical protein
MKSILELLYGCFWIGIIFSCVLVLMMFVVGLAKAFWKIHFGKSNSNKDLYKGI